MDLIVLFLFAVLFSVVGFYARSIFKRPKSTVNISSIVLLEKINKVAKLITVEGTFAEIYHYEDVSRYFINLIPRTKKALLIIKAKASIGYDLRKMKLETDEENKTILITALPEPEVLAIDEHVTFYDKKESWPNKLSAEDLNNISKNAKAFIRDNVMKSELPKTALHQGEEIINTVKTIAAATGWKVEVHPKGISVPHSEAKKFVNILPNKKLS
ncbi:MAG: DUF4230 domain-containing protein [Bacteroidia bacterium]|nr:DUF4230 domain-containing protein [Bacteroidia bacterium]NNM16297.1 DUF4230 domain-containing protein [Bacteroidia bacterium]